MKLRDITKWCIIIYQMMHTNLYFIITNYISNFLTHIKIKIFRTLLGKNGLLKFISELVLI